MKRHISMILAMLLLLSCLVIGAPSASAAVKVEEPRAIALVFDNSGSMYMSGNKAWCRATYAMEVFASMLNEKDVLQIYPMWPITIDGKKYTMEDPFQITGPSQANKIRELKTIKPSGTPIESIDSGAAGLKKLSATKKYLVILTDGGTFSENDHELDKKRTVKKLDERIQKYAGADMTVMYLGIGKEAAVPETKESETFVKNKATDTADVLSMLTVMCNQIFGRDTLPAKNISGKNMEFDISMKKLIVFVQGDSIDNLKIGGGFTGKLVESRKVQYAEKGAIEKYKDCVSDTSLQGMIVTYEGGLAGNYPIEFSGSHTSIEVYYEPDADLDFVFTDSEGNLVDPNALYEGDYKVSFGMKDAKTGKLIESELLGEPKYSGSYFIDGKEHKISHDGFSGSVDVPLKMGEKFEANLTVEYLSGYTIRKTSRDFGWPEGGITVAARPAGDLKIEISGGDDQYSLQDLESGSPFIAKIYYLGQQLTGTELEKVDLKWNPDASNANITKEFSEDHWKLFLHYKDPNAPKDTVCGQCTVDIQALYTAPGSDQSNAFGKLTYDIQADVLTLKVQMTAEEDYIVISELSEGKLITAKILLNGAPLTQEQFAALSEPIVENNGINYTIEPDEANSAFKITLKETPDIEEGNYVIKLKTTYTDEIGKSATGEGIQGLTLSGMPLWLKWLIGIGLLILAIILIWIITHIPALPVNVVTSKANCTLRVGASVLDGPMVAFPSKRDGSTVMVQAKKETQKFGLKFSDVTPGPNSYIFTPQKNRSFVVKVENISMITGGATFKDATIGGVSFTVNPATKKLECDNQGVKQITLRNNSLIGFGGTTFDAGKNKGFNADLQIEFKKK